MEQLEEIYNKINNLNSLLDRKIEILGVLLDITNYQRVFFEQFEGEEMEKFVNLSISEKQKFIDELFSIDSMFFIIFESFKGSLNENKKIFESELKEIQSKIQQITDIDFKIRLQEEKNSHISNIINNNIINNTDKVKTLKVSKNDMLKKYTDNNKI